MRRRDAVLEIGKRHRVPIPAPGGRARERIVREDAMTDAARAARRLLVIEDDPACRTTLAYLLQRLGHTVDAAENGSVGIALLRQQPVDLVVTDLMMPGLSGWDVARLAKAMRPRLPVVLVTGCADAIAPDQPERQLVDAILAKPVGVAALQAVIDPLTRHVAETGNARDPERVGLPTGRGEPMRTPGWEGPACALGEARGIPTEGAAWSATGLAA
jgi:CheY-like chemotaxis protein